MIARALTSLAASIQRFSFFSFSVFFQDIVDVQTNFCTNYRNNFGGSHPPFFLPPGGCAAPLRFPGGGRSHPQQDIPPYFRQLLVFCFCISATMIYNNILSNFNVFARFNLTLHPPEKSLSGLLKSSDLKPRPTINCSAFDLAE